MIWMRCVLLFLGYDPDEIRAYVDQKWVYKNERFWIRENQVITLCWEIV